MFEIFYYKLVKTRFLEDCFIGNDSAELDALTLANVEALAQDESGGEEDSNTPPKECYRKYQLSPGIFGQHSLTRFITCDGCKYVWGYNPRRITICP